METSRIRIYKRGQTSSRHPAYQAFLMHTRLAVGFGRKVALRALLYSPQNGFPDVVRLHSASDTFQRHHY